MDTERRREAIVIEAQQTIARHHCPICDGGSWCDTIVYAQHVLTLNEIFVKQSSETPMAEALQVAHLSGKLEGTAQALAVIGRAEGEFRTQADGKTDDVAFTLAETHRKLATTIRAELDDPTGRTALEIQARAEEAKELSSYVREVSEQFKGSGRSDVAEALDSVAEDISKGSDGVLRLKQAADPSTPGLILKDLITDADPDVRWWAAQNPSTPVDKLIEASLTERHPTVLTALMTNPGMPETTVSKFIRHPRQEVAAAANRRLGL